MIRTPLRPLARILEARRRGENPDAIERENIRLRHERMRDRARRRAEGRLLVLAGLFTLGFIVVGGKMALLAQSEPAEPRSGAAGAGILAQRATITDRRGRVLATNFDTHSLYAQPPQMIDPEGAADNSPRSFPISTPTGSGRISPARASSCGSAARSAPSRSRRCTISASRGCCSARARCGSTPTGRSPRMCWAARALAPRA